VVGLGVGGAKAVFPERGKGGSREGARMDFHLWSRD
jgi:hypothetical protein